MKFFINHPKKEVKKALSHHTLGVLFGHWIVRPTFNVEDDDLEEEGASAVTVEHPTAAHAAMDITEAFLVGWFARS